MSSTTRRHNSREIDEWWCLAGRCEELGMQWCEGVTVSERGPTYTKAALRCMISCAGKWRPESNRSEHDLWACGKGFSEMPKTASPNVTSAERITLLSVRTGTSNAGMRRREVKSERWSECMHSSWRDICHRNWRCRELVSILWGVVIIKLNLVRVSIYRVVCVPSRGLILLTA